MINIHPKNSEEFHLRMLLKNRKGITSFDSIRTVEGTVYPTYKSACIALNLCEDDNNWIFCLNEAVQHQMPIQLRYLFGSILENCNPANPTDLLDQFAYEMSDDFLRIRRKNTLLTQDEQQQQAHNDLLCKLQDILTKQGLSMAMYGLEEPGVTHDTLYTSCENDPDAEIYYFKHEPLLTDDQRRVFNQLTKHIDANEGGLYTIDAPGGSGKTFLCNLILSYARKQKKIAIATALSGIAATLMTKGTTFHKRFGVPVDCTEYSTSSMKPTSNEAMTIKHAVIIFVDEVSMMKGNQLQVLDRLLRIIMSTDKPMGGKLVVLLHDFRQLLPVVPGGTRAHIICESVINSHIWDNFTTFYLKTNMRVINSRKTDDPAKANKLDEYAKWLLSIGDGTIEPALQRTDIVEIKPSMWAEDLEDLNKKVYNEFSTNYNDPSYLKDRAIMSCTNDVIQKCNEEIINKIPGEALVCESVHSFLDDDDYLYHDTGPLTRINSSGLAPHKLVLKVGACIILIRNMSI